MSLIEVLISVLVLAIGILGMAGLQMNAKQTNFEALQRSTASGLVQNMMERMRANPTATALDVYKVDQTTDSGLTNCTTSACSVTELAAWDRWEWRQLLEGASESGRGGLVDPAACITHDAGDVVVTVYWTGLADIKHTSANTCTGLSAGATSKLRVLELRAFISE